MECLKHNGLLQIASLRVNEGNESLWLNFISALLRSAYDHMGFLQLTNANKSWESSFRRASKDKHLEGEREGDGKQESSRNFLTLHEDLLKKLCLG